MKKNIHIIGSGFSSLAAACYLAKAGHNVTVFEKNETIGGRARQLKKDGFTFDIGPTWYWMPDVFERFFADFNKTPEDYYTLLKLAPGYKIFFDQNDALEISDNLSEIITTFEQIEKGAGKKLEKFMATAKSNYDIAIKDLVYRPGESITELITLETAKRINQFFSTISKDVRKKFKNKKLVQALEFPVLFLGAKPSDTPSFYSFMNYADFGLGTWHPKNGMYSVIEGIGKLALELGVKIETNQNVEKILSEDGFAIGLQVNGERRFADMIVSGADYHFTETLLPENQRQYSEAYWDKRVFAPSALLFYLGIDKKMEGISHHALFFDTDFAAHAKSIYDRPEWPKAPLFYSSFPSKTDPTSAPEGMESAVFLIPLAPGLDDIAELREHYFDMVVQRFEAITGVALAPHIIFRKSYCVKDFVADYNSYKGNAYGLANTLLQTAFLRPKLRSGKIRSLYFTGQLTVPGPGVPPALISGKLAAGLIEKDLSQ